MLFLNGQEKHKLQSIHFWGCFSGIRKAEKYCQFLRTLFLVNGYLLLVCFALTLQVEYHMNLWIISLILLLYKPSETLLCCISCVWSVYEIKQITFLLYYLWMPLWKLTFKPLKSFLWIIVSKCFDICKPK